MDGFNSVIESLNKDQEVVITVKDKVRVIYPPYMLTGNGKYSRRLGMCSMDIIGVCEELNRSEYAVFRFFRDCIVEQTILKEGNPNVVKPASWVSYTAYISKGIEKNYKHMEYLGVLKRVHRGKYMVNPYLIIPNSTKGLKLATEAWSELDGMIVSRKVEDV